MPNPLSVSMSWQNSSHPASTTTPTLACTSRRAASTRDSPHRATPLGGANRPSPSMPSTARRSSTRPSSRCSRTERPIGREAASRTESEDAGNERACSTALPGTSAALMPSVRGPCSSNRRRCPPALLRRTTSTARAATSCATRQVLRRAHRPPPTVCHLADRRRDAARVPRPSDARGKRTRHDRAPTRSLRRAEGGRAPTPPPARRLRRPLRHDARHSSVRSLRRRRTRAVAIPPDVGRRSWGACPTAPARLVRIADESRQRLGVYAQLLLKSCPFGRMLGKTTLAGVASRLDGSGSSSESSTDSEGASAVPRRGGRGWRPSCAIHPGVAGHPDRGLPGRASGRDAVLTRRRARPTGAPDEQASPTAFRWCAVLDRLGSRAH